MEQKNYKKILTLITFIIPIVSSKTSEKECFSVKLGYKCCKSCNAVQSDYDGVWGVEDNHWCGLRDSCLKNTNCFSEPFYPCCEKNTVVFTDKQGKWGIENGSWCGIGKSIKSKNNESNATQNQSNKKNENEKDNHNKEIPNEGKNEQDSKDKNISEENNNNNKDRNITKEKQNDKDKNATKEKEDNKDRNITKEKQDDKNKNTNKEKQNDKEKENTKDKQSTNNKIKTSLPKIDMKAWQYNKEDDIYWQVGIFYCENPIDPNYESLGIFIPGQYINAIKNENATTYSCQFNLSSKIGSYTINNAPIVIPITTQGYMSSPSPQDYIKEAKRFTDKGIIYVNTGFRGRYEGAPYGVTDLKAAIRYIRYNKDLIPGSTTENIFTFGFGSGGSQSIILGASGNSPLYNKYLKAIGAIEDESDAIQGSMSWCPDATLDTANEAYEWNMGIARSGVGITDFTKKLSNDLANSYADYINAIQFKNQNGQVLTLIPSNKGNYQSGSYYDYILEEIEISLNEFLSKTEFPYIQLPTTLYLNNGEQYGMDPLDDDETTHGGPITIGDPIVYKTPEIYINSLNTGVHWVTYDSQMKKANVTNLEGFVLRFKRPMKKVGAFDDLEATKEENVLFGYGKDRDIGAHFDPIMAKLLKGTKYSEAFSKDLNRKDDFGTSVEDRIAMYNPLYFLDDYYSGYKTSKVAKYWRIQSGITQTENPLTTEYNLKLALENYGERKIDFHSNWNLGHVKSESSGNSSDNFIQWIKECLESQ
ncbi:hypothetical protein H8356DRAFT_1417414 [Neocallimastix lanati (nom. inval.)]|jgi:hypothetical protein|nr:hypothetical protein H8356DRAFT_1417414 [Neocallimastix sp. JGI-2020a]